MSLHIKDGGSWRTVDQPFVNVGGTWKTVREVHTKHGGTWRKIHTTPYTEYNLSGILTIKSFTKEKWELNRLNKESLNYQRSNLSFRNLI